MKEKCYAVTNRLIDEYKFKWLISTIFLGLFDRLPNNDIILIYVRSKTTPMKNPSISHHHTSPAAVCFFQRRRQPRLRHRGKSHGQMFLTALEPKWRRQIPHHRSVLQEHWDVQEAFKTG